MIVLSAKNINTNVCEFRADMANDLQYLPTTTDYGTGNLKTVAPCASGSVCIVTGTGDVYYLNGDKNEWEIYGSESGSGDSEPPGGWMKDGKAHYWVDIVAENTTIPVAVAIDEQVESETTIDWGDETSDTIVLNTSGTDIIHTYTDIGTYVITLTAPDNRTAYVSRFGGRLNNYGTITGAPYNYGGLIFVEWPTTSLIPERVFFRNHRLRSIVIPESVTDIGTKAFRSCTSLETLIIPKRVTSIGTEAFYQCVSLKSITIPEGVTSIGSSAFDGCTSLRSITIPEGVTKINANTFNSCLVLRSITLPESITSFDNYAFSGCITLETITIPENVTSFGYGVFSGCASLRSITIPESVTNINERAFSGCSLLETVTIPESVTSLDYEVFRDCALLKTITIPESVTNINERAFKGCVSLTSITIPEDVTSIGYDAFSDCSSLSSMTILATTPPTLGSNAIPTTITAIYVPAASVNTYKAAANWSTFADKIQAIPT